MIVQQTRLNTIGYGGGHIKKNDSTANKTLDSKHSYLSLGAKEVQGNIHITIHLFFFLSDDVICVSDPDLWSKV